RGCVVLLGTLLLGQPTAGIRAEPPPARQVGDFTLRDSGGKTHTRRDWRDRKAVVLFFLGTECPVSNGYAPEMARLAKAFGTGAAPFLGVPAAPDVTADAATRHATEYGLPFPVLLDPDHLLARPAGVRVVPEAVVLSPAGKVLYRGRIDDRYAPDGKRRDEP